LEFPILPAGSAMRMLDCRRVVRKRAGERSGSYKSAIVIRLLLFCVQPEIVPAPL